MVDADDVLRRAAPMVDADDVLRRAPRGRMLAGDSDDDDCVRDGARYDDPSHPESEAPSARGTYVGKGHDCRRGPRLSARATNVGEGHGMTECVT